jgi:penicillin-binding protein-related factor A (putative recombinase)
VNVSALKNDGSDAERAFKGALKGAGKKAYLHELTDTRKIKGAGFRKGFSMAQPADNLCVIDGEMCLVEIKSTIDPERFKKAAIRKDQWANAVMVTKAGGAYYFCVRFEPIKQWYKIPASFLIKSDQASWTWAELDTYRWELP